MKEKITIFLMTLLFSHLVQAQQTLNESILHDGVIREYRVYIPAIYDGSSPVPLMFNFHGYTFSANYQMTTISDMRPISDTAGFILVYPQGTLDETGAPHWNSGGYHAGSTADDIGFTEAMIDTLSAHYNIDSNRVYSCGYSNGGEFSFLLACQLSDRIAGMGSVAGSMSLETYTSCNPSHPTPVVTFHGTDDIYVSYNGGTPVNSLSLATVNSYWSTFNNTSTSPIVSNLPDIDSSDGSTVELSLYDGGDICPPVEHYKVIGGGHSWPGSTGNMDIDASSIIWNFLSKYDLNVESGCITTSITESHELMNDISVYPNPTTGFINIRMNSTKNQQYKIYSILGKIVQSGVLNANSTTIDLSNLSPNIYLLRIDNRAITLISLQ